MTEKLKEMITRVDDIIASEEFHRKEAEKINTQKKNLINEIGRLFDREIKASDGEMCLLIDLVVYKICKVKNGGGYVLSKYETNGFYQL